MQQIFSGNAGTGAVFLCLAAILVYIAVRAIFGALCGLGVERAQVLATVIPAVTGAAVVAGAGHPAAAMFGITGAAVACLTLVLGLTATTREPGENGPAFDQPLEVRPIALVFPAGALLGLLALVGDFDLIAVLPAVIGSLALLVLVGMGRTGVKTATFGVAGTLMVVLGLAAIIGAIGLVGLSADWMANSAGQQLPELFATVVGGPILAIPLVGITSLRAMTGQKSAAMSSCIRSAVMTMAVGLPIVLLIGLIRVALEGPAGDEPWTLWDIAFPAGIRLWRLDAAVLALVGLILLPVATGRGRISGMEGIILLLLFPAYLVATTLMTW